MVEHGGGQGGYGSWMMRFPGLHLSVVVLFNHFLWDMQDYALKVANLFVEERIMPEIKGEDQATPAGGASPIELSAEHLEQKVGVYFNAQRPAVREIRYAGGRIQFQEYDLVPLSENLFYFEVEPQTQVEFIPAIDGSIVGMKTINGAKEYEYKQVKTVSPTAEMLAQYAGRYYCSELDIYWTIEAHDNHLIGKRRKYRESKLTPVFTDTFSDDWGPLMGYPTVYFVVFERSESGLLTGLRVSGIRVRSLRFTRLND